MFLKKTRLGIWFCTAAILLGLTSCGAAPEDIPAEGAAPETTAKSTETAALPAETTGYSETTAAQMTAADAKTHAAASISRPTTTKSHSATTTGRASASATTLHVHGSESVMTFSTLLEYKDKLLTLSNGNALYQAFLSASEYGRYTLHESDFEMLLIDGYFLLPVLPTDSTLTEVKFLGNGDSEFTVKLSDGHSAFFICQHNKKEPGAAENAERTTIVNSRGLSIDHDRSYDTWTEEYYGYYTWKEGDYFCRMPYEGGDAAVYESFLKELSFEKISLNEQNYFTGR